MKTKLKIKVICFKKSQFFHCWATTGNWMCKHMARNETRALTRIIFIFVQKEAMKNYIKLMLRLLQFSKTFGKGSICMLPQKLIRSTGGGRSSHGWGSGKTNSRNLQTSAENSQQTDENPNNVNYRFIEMRWKRNDKKKQRA